MNQPLNSANSVLRHSVPLFASSWLALFLTIRHGLCTRESPPDGSVNAAQGTSNGEDAGR